MYFQNLPITSSLQTGEFGKGWFSLRFKRHSFSVDFLFVWMSLQYCLWSCNYGLLLVLFFTSAFICPKWQCCLSLQFLHLDMASFNLKFFFFLMLSTFRYSQYKKMREAIDKYEGGLEAFSRGYEKMGFTRR